MQLTKDQQWKTVIDALAVSCVALRVGGVPSSRGRVALAFKASWRGWPASSNYPSVNPDDFFLYAIRSTRRKGTSGEFTWKESLTPALTGGVELDDIDGVLDDIAATSGVAVDQWLALARAFVSRAQGDETL